MSTLDDARTFLAEFDERVRMLTTEQESLFRKLSFLQSAEKNRPPAPNPWIAASIFTGVTLFISAITVGQAPGITVIIMGVGLGIAGLVLTSEMKRYAEFVTDLHHESEKRQEKINNIHKQNEDIQKEILNNQKRGNAAVEMLAGRLSSEEIVIIQDEFPLIFPPR
jgi:prefoldin subunit 5